MKNRLRRLSRTQVIALGYLIMILIGTALLLIPSASRQAGSVSFTDAFFTATSASCVTGLILHDTFTYWTTFGQIVIICLIQIGGLGFMTMATLFFTFMKKNMGLQQRELMVESINAGAVGGIMPLTKMIVKYTAIFELCGAALLSIRFIPDFGVGRGIYFSLFHSVSAFCNAGFDLMGTLEPYCSFVYLYNDVFVNIVLMLLITLGGLGFLVWTDLMKSRFRWKRFSFHTKLVLSVSAILSFGGALLLFIFESGATGAGMSTGDRILTALFASVTTRTAGFNTVDIASMSPAGKLLTIMLMVVGGSPGSTAGGVKTTTVAVIALYAFCGFRGTEKPSLFGRSISLATLKKSCTILFFNVGLALAAALVLSSVQSLDLVDVLFETFSAVGTVGMTAGITRELIGISAYTIIILMYLGRVGSVSFAVALLEKRAKPPVSFPDEEITVG